MKLAVTGSTGFIGTHILPMLLSHGHHVIALVEPGVQAGFGDVETRVADVCTGEGLAAGLVGTDGVIHLAARNHVLKETEKNPLSAFRRVNVDGTRNVIRAAIRGGARWFIHFSSVKAMGEGGNGVLDENSPCRPTTDYGISKLESEEAAGTESAGSGTALVVLRLPMVYGPGNRGNLPRMIRWADRGLPFPLFQPDNQRSMVYVGNVGAGVMAILTASPAGASTYILKDREDYSTRRIYSTICSELGKKPRFFPIPSAVVKVGGSISGDFRKVTGSFRVHSGKMEREIGFTPPFSLEEGIARTVDWYKRSNH